ncbi:MAG: DUF4105 domain-containing protein [Bacteroidaceae bacterium]|nr:DUF4105 domain-containing protein [Bacteroidaceae bacterium]
MKSYLRFIQALYVAWFFLVTWVTTTQAQNPVIEDSTAFLRVSLLVAEPSEQHPQSVFGHAFLRMQCPPENLDYCFSMESGDYENFLDICTGNYPNRLVCVPTAEYVGSFRREGRIVTGYPLNLTLEESQRLWRILDETVSQGLSPYHDFFYHGCSREIIRLLGYSLDGKIVYGSTAQKYGNTIFVLGNQSLPENSWMHLPPSLLSTTDGTDRILTAEEKTMIPYIIPDLLSDACIVDEVGGNRPVLKDEAPEVFMPTQHQSTSTRWPPYVWFVLLLCATLIVGILSLLSIASKPMKWFISAFDALLFTSYQLLWMVPFGICILSSLPTTSGWNWNYIIYNPIPLIIYGIDCHRPFSVRVRANYYIVYTIVLVLFMVCMAVAGDHLIAEQYLITSTFAVRCIFKAINHHHQIT